jgi:transcriptional regulator with XRE-family HTH domain
VLQGRREFLKWSLHALAKAAGVDRSTLIQVLSGKRPCSRRDRLAILRALGVPPEVLRRFCPDYGATVRTDIGSPGSEGGKTQEISTPAPTNLQNRNVARLLETARHLRAHSRFSESWPIFLGLLRDAEMSGDRLLQFELAGDLSWLEYEQGRYKHALQWYEYSKHRLESHTGFTMQEILESVHVRNQSNLLSVRDHTSHVLSHILHIRRKILIERTVFCESETQRPERFGEALEAVEKGATLDRFLNLDYTQAHDNLWQSVLLVHGPQAYDWKAKRSLKEAESVFRRGELGELYLSRAHGIYYCRTGREKLAREYLTKAAHGFPSFADARALGPTLYWLSQVEQQGRACTEQAALRFALAGAVVHPYGFVRRNALEFLKKKIGDKRFLQRVRNEVEAGSGFVFGMVHEMLRQLSRHANKTVGEVIRQNLGLAGADSLLIDRRDPP